MLARTRRLAASSIAVSAVSMVAFASTASAATPPPWDGSTTPTSSSTCVMPGSPTSDPTHLFVSTYTDSGLPTITDVQFGHASTYVLAPGATNVPLHVLATETCSGVGDVRIALTKSPSTFLPFTSMTFDTTDAFHASVTQVAPLTTTYAGVYHAAFGLVTRRYDSFQIGIDGAYVTSSPGTGGTYVSGPWSTKKLYLLLKTTLTAAATKASVKKGVKVTFSTVLKKASGSTYTNASGEAVLFQTRIGKGKWVTRATRTTTAAGAASYAFAPTTTMTWRWVHANRLTGTFTAAGLSVVKTIKVT
jgi:hypothetical protein